MNLTYLHRKALRRLGRGQSISKTMQADSVIRECYTLEIGSIDPYEYSLPIWGLTEYGKQLLDELNQEDEQ